MLEISVEVVPELWNEETQEFIPAKEQKLQLEHSLVSLSKWESKWCKAFLSKEPKTTEQTIDYIKCMTLTKNVDPDIYNNLSNSNITEINRYIESPMTASVVPDIDQKSGVKDTPTAEIIYYWMIALQIPFECQRWHLNRLLSLIKVCNYKNQPENKRRMSNKELMSRNAALNEARRLKHNSKG